MGDRTSTAGLSASRLSDLRDAFSAMYALRDERGWAFHAGVHGLPLPISCTHGTLLFLPWHRAYLYFFERALTDALRRARGDQTVSVNLPWWDWTSPDSHVTGLPPTHLDLGGLINPLSAGPVTLGDSDLQMVRDQVPGAITDGDDPRTLRDPGDADELPRAATVNRVLRARTFTDFTRLLEGIHNGVHGWVGGSMSVVPISSYDPIFWAHHAMIDRIWHLWQISGRGVNPPASLIDRALAPWPMTVRQTLDISTLGYGYAAQVVG